MGNNKLYFIVGLLAAAVIGLGAYIYHEQTKPQGVEIKVNENGIKIQGN